MLAHLLIACMRLLGQLPLPWLRALGAGLGWVLFHLAGRRRQVALTNLRLCFPDRPETWHQATAKQVFITFAQTWLDRAWLWHAPPEVVRQRVQLQGALEVLHGSSPVVVFAPHFMGLDVGWTALTLAVPRLFTTIYSTQSNPVVDAWVAQGRRRFGQVRLFQRHEGVRNIVSSLKAGECLYLLPDMDFGPDDSTWAPFFGVQAATVPSLSRFARLGRAQVVPVLTRLTPEGYVVDVLPPWADLPSDDTQIDTEVMNQRLQTWVEQSPQQYYWVHKRFKTRPTGSPSVYEKK